MCGLTGFVRAAAAAPQDNRRLLQQMAARLQHRGPDDAGVWCEQNIGLAHRRLSIIDTSAEGHQPMMSFCGAYLCVYNGEIYNYRELRRLIEQRHGAIPWRGGSDTEVLLAAISVLGMPQALREINGMFAFVVVDRARRRLYLARDRLGEKPLYYGGVAGDFVFASELKALTCLPGWTGEINEDAVARYLRLGYVPTPESIYRGIVKLRPGCFLDLPLDEPLRDLADTVPQRYWDIEAVVDQRRVEEVETTALVGQVHTALRAAVASRLVADVPVGAFLSGGLDSSTVVALMQDQIDGAARTFTIGFEEDDFDEAAQAKAVARHLGTDHTELYLSSRQALDVIPRLPTIYDEPFADPSQIPTFLISRLAQQDVKVALTGDGGDEIFGGYSRYFWAADIWRVVGRLPKTLRRLLAQSMRSIAPGSWDRLWRLSAWAMPKRYQQRLPGEKLHKLANVLTADSRRQLYFQLISHWQRPNQVLAQANEHADAFTFAADRQLPDYRETMMFWDTTGYLPDDILVKVDRASMATSLETRVPFLDHRLVETAWRLPIGCKIRDGFGKWVLREILQQYVPDRLVDRPKMGFAIPLAGWLRGPLREWAESLLLSPRLASDGLLNPRAVREIWQQHVSGARDQQYPLWNLLMLQSWLETYA